MEAFDHVVMTLKLTTDVKVRDIFPILLLPLHLVILFYSLSKGKLHVVRWNCKVS
jgi:hypothetical protein